MAALAAALAVQCVYQIRYFARISPFRNPQKRSVDGLAVSVVVVVHDNTGYIRDTLPLLLEQEYGSFEVMVVGIDCDEDMKSALEVLQAKYPHLAYTNIEQDRRFPVSNKIALNIGIKSARNEHIIITTTDSRPRSRKWLPLMVRGFAGGDVILGYCALEHGRSFSSRLTSCGRLSEGIYYLSSAISGHPFRGLIQNIGFTKALYFSVRGFNYLSLPAGEDDLFIQSIASRENTGIVMNPNTTLLQHNWGGLGVWIGRRLRSSRTHRYYPLRAKRFVTAELMSRALFFISAAVLLVSMPANVRIAVAALLALRWTMVAMVTARITKRLGDKGLLGAYMVYDLISPVLNFILFLGRVFTPKRRRWQ